MKKVYINGISSISAQKTFDSSQFLDELVAYDDNVIPAANPNYKEFIPPAAARRMAKGIKMGIVASKLALQHAKIEQVDAILTGTGMGCLRDSEKFLGALIDNNEEYLTPTPFIQSTHNTVGGQIALELQCKGYNFTYVHSSISFESALLDAKMQLQTDEANTILVGGVDELSDRTVDMHKLIGHVKEENVGSGTVLTSGTKGAVFSEGANFFVLGNIKTETSTGELIALETFNTLPKENIENALSAFLKKNHVDATNIDLLVSGNNGDVDFDDRYDVLANGIFKQTPQAVYKHQIGEYNTASSFAFWLANKVFAMQSLPKTLQLNGLEKPNYTTILLYNQYRGENHSFTLLQKC